MTNEERHKGLLEIANTPIRDLYAYTVAAQQINEMIESARKVFGGLSTESQFAEFTEEASSNLTGNEIILLAQCLNRFLFAGPLVDSGRTALRKDVTVAELAYLKRATDFLQVNFQISATALGMMRIFAGRAAGAADFWGMTPADMEKELATIAPRADMVDVFKKMVKEQFAAMGGKLDTLTENQKRAADAAEQTHALVKAHLPPRPADYKVTQAQLCAILEGLKCPRTAITIQRWEKYLSTGGREGTKPPDGYTLQTRMTLESASAWARFFADHEKSKLNTKVSLDRMTGGRQ